MDRYIDAHKSPKGPGDARPTAEQIIQDENLIGKLSGKTILITGGTGGLGYETARVLRQTGARIFITARTEEKGEEAVRSLNNGAFDSRAVEFVVLDLGSLDSVRKGAADLLSRTNVLNILIDNAGVMACPEGKTVDSFETQFGTNHLGHFLLFHLLKSTLLASITPAFNSRVVSVSSSAHRGSDIHPDNYNLTGEYEAWKAYGQSKTANILFANEIDRRYGSEGLHALSLHPGVIMETELSRHLTDTFDEAMKQMLSSEAFINNSKSTGQGAATQVWAAVAKALEGRGGLYLDDVQVASEITPDGLPFGPGWSSYIWNEKNAGKLWKDSLKFVNLPQED